MDRISKTSRWRCWVAGYGSKSRGCCSLLTLFSFVLLWSLLNIGLAILLIWIMVRRKVDSISSVVDFSIWQSTPFAARYLTLSLKCFPTDRGLMMSEEEVVNVGHITEIANRFIFILTVVIAALTFLQGIMGMIGILWRRPLTIFCLWILTIGSFLVYEISWAFLPLLVQSRGVNFHYLLLILILLPLIILPPVAWTICNDLFSLYRILSVGGTGREGVSVGEVEKLRLAYLHEASTRPWITAALPGPAGQRGTQLLTTRENLERFPLSLAAQSIQEVLPSDVTTPLLSSSEETRMRSLSYGGVGGSGL